MKLYKIRQTVNQGYDTYDSAIVAAESEEEARRIHPLYGLKENFIDHDDTWAKPECVSVELIGIAIDGTTRSIIMTSYYYNGDKELLYNPVPENSRK